jgi:hypothetical protein
MAISGIGGGSNALGSGRWIGPTPIESGAPAGRVGPARDADVAAAPVHVLKALSRRFFNFAQSEADDLIKKAGMTPNYFLMLSGPGTGANGDAQRTAVARATEYALARVGSDLFPNGGRSSLPGRIAMDQYNGQPQLLDQVKKTFGKYLKEELTRSAALKNSPGQVISKPGYQQNRVVDDLTEQLSTRIQQWLLGTLNRLLNGRHGRDIDFLFGSWGR